MTTYYCKKHGALRPGDEAFADYSTDPLPPLCQRCLYEDLVARGIGVLTETPPPPAIKPCPFCGCGGAVAVGLRRFVRCPSCEATGPYMEQTEADAIAKWNQRA